MQGNANRRRVTGHVRLVKRKRGDVYYGKLRIPGQGQRNLKLGLAWTKRGRPADGYLTERAAKEALAAIIDDEQRKLGTLVRSGATFADAAAEWLRYVEFDRKRRHSTVREYGHVVRARLVPHFGSMPLESITIETVEDYRDQLIADGTLADETINRRLRILHGIFKRAQRVWKLPLNPAAGVEKRPVASTLDFYPLSPAEVAALARAAHTPMHAALFQVAAFTGLRQGELIALRWADVSFTKRVVQVRRSITKGVEGPTKSGRVRAVPMDSDVVRALDRLSRRAYFTGPDDHVFTNEVGKPLDPARLRRRFKEAVARAGLPPMRFHDLRHVFCTNAVQVFPLTDVMAYAGHAHVTTTLRYAHHVPQHDAADKLDRAKLASGDYASSLGGAVATR